MRFHINHLRKKYSKKPIGSTCKIKCNETETSLSQSSLFSLQIKKPLDYTLEGCSHENTQVKRVCILHCLYKVSFTYLFLSHLFIIAYS